MKQTKWQCPRCESIYPMHIYTCTVCGYQWAQPSGFHVDYAQDAIVQTTAPAPTPAPAPAPEAGTQPEVPAQAETPVYRHHPAGSAAGDPFLTVGRGQKLWQGDVFRTGYAAPPTEAAGKKIDAAQPAVQPPQPPPAPQQKKGSGDIARWIVGLAVVAILIITICVLINLSNYSESKKQRFGESSSDTAYSTMPNLVGMTVKDAQAQYPNLRLRYNNQAASPDYDNYTITWQDLEAGDALLDDIRTVNIKVK